MPCWSLAGDDALAGLLALAIETERRALLDVGDFDTANDAAFVERLYMPGLRRAGDLSTASPWPATAPSFTTPVPGSTSKERQCDAKS